MLATALAFRPDLIILDFIIPDIDGADISNQLAANALTKKIPVIFLTAIATKEDTQERGKEIDGIWSFPNRYRSDLIENIDRVINQTKV